MAVHDASIVHLNARVRAMKASLFDRPRYEALVEQNDLAMLIEVLLNSPYQREMAAALATHRGADAVEEGVSRNLVSTLDRLVRLAAGPVERAARVLFMRWDLVAAKSLLRAMHHGLRREEAVPMLVPGPQLRMGLLRELAARDGMESLVQGLTSWNPQLCGALARQIPAYRRSGDLAAMEEGIDRAYFVDIAGQLRHDADEHACLVMDILRMEIDRVNVRGALRALMDGERDAAEARLLPGGHLTYRMLREMARAANVAEAMEHLGPTPYRELVERLYVFLQSRRFAPLERMFDTFILTRLRRMARVHVFTIAVLMHYLWLKSNEVMNLRLIARGESRHLPKGLIREELVYG